MDKGILLYTDFKDLKLFRRGKVRDVYDLEDKLLIVSTDRISCFDVVLPNGIPNKGKVLTSISCFWFDFLKDIVSHHLITSDVREYPSNLQKYKSILSGRSMLVKKTKPFPVECIVRGYLSGSGWKEYKSSQTVCGIKLPQGLKESAKLPQTIFTPSTKEDIGHDINVNQKHVEDLVGRGIAERLKEISIAIYEKASAYAKDKGIIIADTKFEFGISVDQSEREDNESAGIMLIDEVLTPDSSRFWPSGQYNPGQAQVSFDKQFVRDYLESIHWQKKPPAPELPEEIIIKTSSKYLEAFERLTGKKIPPRRDDFLD
ncbi:MAG: phosphoribosylaminoimidazolesuccinocarboxamide synthase [Candidatus Omnitrophota bacterium]